MFDVDHGGRRYRDPFTGHLDAKALSLFDAVGQTAQFGDELFPGITLFDVSLRSRLLYGHEVPFRRSRSGDRMRQRHPKLRGTCPRMARDRVKRQVHA
jgi:hypothetical protein